MLSRQFGSNWKSCNVTPKQVWPLRLIWTMTERTGCSREPARDDWDEQYPALCYIYAMSDGGKCGWVLC